jgi:quinol monooxygenase YgiN
MKTLSFFLILGLLIPVLACTKKQPAPAETSSFEPVADTLSKKMITAKIFIKPENVADFIEAAKVMIDSSNAEPGCESYMLYQNPYDNTKFIFVETWKDQAAIDAHFAMPYFVAWGPKTKDWLSQPGELKILDVVLSK